MAASLSRGKANELPLPAAPSVLGPAFWASGEIFAYRTDLGSQSRPLILLRPGTPPPEQTRPCAWRSDEQARLTRPALG